MPTVTIYPNETPSSNCRSYPDTNPNLHHTLLDDDHDDSDYVYDNPTYPTASILLGFQALGIPANSIINSAVLHYSGGATGAAGWFSVRRNDVEIVPDFRVSDGYMTEYFCALAAPLSVALLDAIAITFLLTAEFGGGCALGYCHIVVDYTLRSGNGCAQLIGSW